MLDGSTTTTPDGPTLYVTSVDVINHLDEFEVGPVRHHAYTGEATE